METSDDYLDELRSLLNQARNPALLLSDAQRILARSAALARQFPSERAELLHRQTETALETRGGNDGAAHPRTRGRPGANLSSPSSPRLAALQRRLDGNGSWQIGTLSLALQDGAFHAHDELTAAEAVHFQALVAGPLLQVAELYRCGDGLSPVQLRTAVSELRNLKALIPVCAAEAAASAQALIAELAHRADETEARTRIERLLLRLETLSTGESAPRSRIVAARKALDQNAWAAAHADDPRVRAAEQLLRGLKQKRAARALVDRLEARVRHALSAGEMGMDRALDLIAEAHLSAQGGQLRQVDALRQAAGQVAATVARVLEALSTESTPDVDAEAALPESLKRTHRAEQALGWLRQLPAPLREHVAQLEQDVRAVSTRAAQESQALLVRRIGSDLQRLSPHRVAGYAERLRKSVHPLVRWHGVRIGRLAALRAEIESAGDTMDAADLEWFACESSELPEGALRSDLTAAATACREGRAELDALLRAVESSESTMSLRSGLERLRQRFPAWNRPLQALESLDDMELLRRIRESASLADAGMDEALRLADGITVAERRERVISALRHVSGLRRRMGELDAAVRSLDAGELRDCADRADEVTNQAQGLLADTEGPFASACADELPALWHDVDRAVREAVMQRVPAALERWLERAAFAAHSAGELEALGRSFGEHAQTLGAVFHAERGRHLIGRTRLDLLLGPLMEAGKYDRARELLLTEGDMLHPGEIAERQGRVEAGAALARLQSGEPGALDGVVEVVLGHGVFPELVEVLVVAFGATGVTAPLAAVARQGEAKFEPHRGVAQMARWCLRFETDDLDTLVVELQADAAKGVREQFLAALAHTPERQAQALYVLRAMQDVGGRAEREQTARGLGQLTAGLESAHTGLLHDLDALESALDELPAFTARGARPRSRAEIQDAAATAARAVAEALSSVTRWHAATERAEGWTQANPVPRRAHITLARLRALRTRLQANQEVLSDVEDALAADPSEGAARWEQVQVRIVALGRDAVAPVFALSRLVHEHIPGSPRT